MLNRKAQGMLIKNARKLKGKKLNKKFTQQELADLIGISRSYLSDIENGRVAATDEILEEIANACDVTVDYFFDEKEIEKMASKSLKRAKTISKENSFTDNLIKMLIETGYLNANESINDVDEETKNIILNAVLKDAKRIKSQK